MLNNSGYSRYRPVTPHHWRVVTFDHQNITTVSLNCVPETSVVFCKTCSVFLFVFCMQRMCCQSDECASQCVFFYFYFFIFVRIFVCVSQEVLHVYCFTAALGGPTLKWGFVWNILYYCRISYAKNNINAGWWEAKAGLYTEDRAISYLLGDHYIYSK